MLYLKLIISFIVGAVITAVAIDYIATKEENHELRSQNSALRVSNEFSRLSNQMEIKKNKEVQHSDEQKN